MASKQSLTAEDVRDLVGPLDDDTVAQILATGATHAELLEAVAWCKGDDRLSDALTRRSIVECLCDLLEKRTL
jgi:hypothetical protein